MSYALDLDEFSNEKLLEEFNRRKKMTLIGHCDYCERRYEDPPCKFPDRHAGRDTLVRAASSRQMSEEELEAHYKKLYYMLGGPLGPAHEHMWWSPTPEIPWEYCHGCKTERMK